MTSRLEKFSEERVGESKKETICSLKLLTPEITNAQYEKCPEEPKSNLCGNCYDDFEGEGVQIPMDRDVYGRLRFLKQVRFCCLGCAARYIITHMGQHKRLRMILLNAYAREKLGVNGPIEPSPSIYLHERHGGPLSKEEYRAKTKKDVELYSSPGISYIMVMSRPQLLDKKKKNTSRLQFVDDMNRMQSQ